MRTQRSACGIWRARSWSATTATATDRCALRRRPTVASPCLGPRMARCGCGRCRAKPRVWCLVTRKHQTPTTKANALRGLLRLEGGPERVGLEPDWHALERGELVQSAQEDRLQRRTEDGDDQEGDDGDRQQGESQRGARVEGEHG